MRASAAKEFRDAREGTEPACKKASITQLGCNLNPDESSWGQGTPQNYQGSGTHIAPLSVLPMVVCRPLSIIDGVEIWIPEKEELSH